MSMLQRLIGIAVLIALAVPTNGVFSRQLFAGLLSSADESQPHRLWGLRMEGVSSSPTDQVPPRKAMLGTSEDLSMDSYSKISLGDPKEEDSFFSSSLGLELENEEIGDDEEMPPRGGPSGFPGSPPSKPLDSEDTVDDIADSGLDEDAELETVTENTLSSSEVLRLQDILQSFVQKSDSMEKLNAYVFSNQSAPESGNVRDEMYRLLLRQCLRPLHTTGVHAVLDTDMLLSLKGSCLLAQHAPPLITSSLPLARAIRITRPPLSTEEEAEDEPEDPASRNHHAMQVLLVRALLQSVQSNWIVLNAKVLHKIRLAAGRDPLLHGITLTNVDIIKALLSWINQAPAPCCVVVNDNAQWLLGDASVAQVMLEEVQVHRSKLLLIVLDASDGSSQSPSTSAPSSPLASPPLSMPSPSTVFPPPPLLPPGAGPMPFHVAVRGFQISITNGTATLTPINSQPPPDVIRRMLESVRVPPGMNMSITNGAGMGPVFPPGGISFPMFPPDMSEEEVQEFMQDPENQPRIRALLDQVLHQFAMQQGMPGVFGGPAQWAPGLPPAVPPGLPGQAPMNSKVQTLSMPRAGPGVAPPPLVNMNAMRPHPQASARPDSAPRMPSFSPQSSQLPSPTLSSAVPHSGQALRNLWQTIVLPLPTRHTHRQLFQRVVQQAAHQRTFALNRHAFQSFFQTHGWTAPPPTHTWTALFDLLKRRALTEEEIRQILALAVRYQSASQASTIPSLSAGTPSLSLWAWQRACAAFLSPSRVLGKARGSIGLSPSRPLSKDELARTLSLDKYERNLLSNLVFSHEIEVSYADIGGLEDVKTSLQQSLSYPLKYPDLYNQQGIGAEAVKGVLLFGPPGTGKTMLAKAIATEGEASFLVVDSGTIENKWLGESEKNAKAVFSLARKLSPCIIFFDEVDSLLSSREHAEESSHGTLTSVKTTLMQEWDGLRSNGDRVIVIASTNRPFDLDEAVLRRLPRRLLIDLPDEKTRERILHVVLQRNVLAPDVNITVLARELQGYTGSDIKEVCREACVRVAHERAQRLEEGLERRKENGERKDLESGVAAVEEGQEEEGGESLDRVLREPLRPVEMRDFRAAMKKLKASVDDTGREMHKVLEWNDKYGEVKRQNKKPEWASNLYV